MTPAQLAVAWVMHQGHEIIPIPGTRASSTSKKTSPQHRSTSVASNSPASATP
jgi:hypothetical protein